MLPTYNHTRGDSCLEPCPICKKLQDEEAARHRQADERAEFDWIASALTAMLVDAHEIINRIKQHPADEDGGLTDGQKTVVQHLGELAGKVSSIWQWLPCNLR